MAKAALQTNIIFRINHFQQSMFWTVLDLSCIVVVHVSMCHGHERFLGGFLGSNTFKLFNSFYMQRILKEMVVWVDLLEFQGSNI